MWGVFQNTDTVHVCPCDQEGVLRDGHKTDDTCFCSPEWLEVLEDGRILVVHNEVH